MEIKRRTQDLETVFNQRWNANNFKKNGMEKAVKENQEAFYRMHNIKPKEQQKKELLEANSVNGQITRLKANMDAASSLTNRNNFRKGKI